MWTPRIQYIRGFPFSNAPWFKKENIENTLDYVPCDGDVIVASYPKTGTTWLQYITLQILSRGTDFPSFDDALHKVAPFMEMTGVEAVENMKPPRIYKHHYPYNMVQKNKNAKYLYIYRNPADTFVSYFYFLQEQKHDSELDFDQFFEGYVSGKIQYGRIFDHIRSYMEHKDDGNVLLISYEGLMANRKEEILRIAKFLGDEYFRDLSNDESLLDKIIEQTSFNYMKKNLTLTHPAPTISTPINFFRKGVTGEGKKSLSQDQLKRLKEVAAETMEGTELFDIWFKD